MRRRTALSSFETNEHDEVRGRDVYDDGTLKDGTKREAKKARNHYSLVDAYEEYIRPFEALKITRIKETMSSVLIKNKMGKLVKLSTVTMTPFSKITLLLSTTTMGVWVHAHTTKRATTSTQHMMHVRVNDTLRASLRVQTNGMSGMSAGVILPLRQPTQSRMRMR